MIGHAHAPPLQPTSSFVSFPQSSHTSAVKLKTAGGAPPLPVRAPSPFIPARDMEQVLVTRPIPKPDIWSTTTQ